MRIQLCPLVLVLLSLVLFPKVLAQRNVTLDDQDIAIVYAPPGSWSQTNRTSLDHGGSHMLTEDPEATATFNFTGTAIYFLSPRWPYSVNVAISLDSSPIVIVDLVDYSRPDVGSGAETVKSDVVWMSLGLANTQHTLVVSVAPGQPYAIVDALRYTEVDPTSSFATSSSSSTSSVSSTSSQSSVSTISTTPSLTGPSLSSSAFPTITAVSSTDDPGAVRRKNIAIALGSIAGVIALLLIFGILCFLSLSRRRKRLSDAWSIDGSSYDGNYANSNGQRYSQSQWVSGDIYPVGQRVSQGFVGEMSPPQPAQQGFYVHPQRHHYGQYANGAAPSTDRYVTGNSPQQVVGPHSPLLANSSTVGVNTVSPLNADDLPGYDTAPAFARPGRGRPLVVVGGLGDSEMGPYDEVQNGAPNTQQLSPAREKLASYAMRSSRRLL